MTSKDIYNAIGGIDPEFVLKSAPEYERRKARSKRMMLLKILSAAACFAIILGVGIFTIPNLTKSNGEDEISDVAYAVWVGNFLYEPISAGDDAYFPEVKALASGTTGECKYDIKEEHLGEYIGVVPAVEAFGEPEGKAYRFAPYPDYDAVIIVEQMGKYRFFISRGGALNEEISHNSSSALELFGLPNTCVSVNIDRERNITDRAVFEQMFGILGGKAAVSSDTIDRIQWEAWCSVNGDGSVFFDSGVLSFKDSEAHVRYNAFISENAHVLLYTTSRGFYDQMISLNLEYNYFTLCGRYYMLTEAEAGQLEYLLGLKA